MTIDSIAKALIAYSKLPPSFVLAVAVGSGSLMFLDDGLLGKIGFLQIMNDHRTWFGIIFVAACIWLIGIALNYLFKFINRNYIRHQVIHYLHGLTEEEKQILRYYIAKGTKCNYLRQQDGVVNGLIRHGVIYSSSLMGNTITGFACNIHDFVWAYLNKNKHLLEGETNTCITHKPENVIPGASMPLH